MGKRANSELKESYEGDAWTQGSLLNSRGLQQGHCLAGGKEVMGRGRGQSEQSLPVYFWDVQRNRGERRMEGGAWGWWVSVADAITEEGPGANALFPTLSLDHVKDSPEIVYLIFTTVK